MRRAFVKALFQGFTSRYRHSGARQRLKMAQSLAIRV
jgi:hypothetical protein